MDDRSSFERVAQAHQLHMTAAILADCSCGEWSGHGGAGSLADWAAHVHVAAGLAEEEDRRANEPGTSAPTVKPPAWGGGDSRPTGYTGPEATFIDAATGSTLIRPCVA